MLITVDTYMAFPEVASAATVLPCRQTLDNGCRSGDNNALARCAR
jgi:hypothetical protein